MSLTAPFDGSLRFARQRWPKYVGLSVALLAFLGIALYSVGRGWPGLVLLAVIAFVLLGTAGALSLAAVHRLYDGETLAATILDAGRIGSDDSLVFLDVAQRPLAVAMSQRLITGQIVTIDLYNPQLTPDRALGRAYHGFIHPPADPRLVWRDGRIDLLPFPDASVKTVVAPLAASELWQRGDRLVLLREAFRILVPGGQLLLLERVSTQMGLLRWGPEAWRPQPAEYWPRLLQEAGFRVGPPDWVASLAAVWRAHRPIVDDSRQLRLELGWSGEARPI
jgi:SAM-dependent methyltransferase